MDVPKCGRMEPHAGIWGRTKIWPDKTPCEEWTYQKLAECAPLQGVETATFGRKESLVGRGGEGGRRREKVGRKLGRNQNQNLHLDMSKQMFFLFVLLIFAITIIFPSRHSSKMLTTEASAISILEHKIRF